MKKFNNLNIKFINYIINKNNKLINKLNKNEVEVISIHKIINQNSNIKLNFDRLNDISLLKLVRKNNKDIYTNMQEILYDIVTSGLLKSKKRRYYNFIKWCKKIDKIKEAQNEKR